MLRTWNDLSAAIRRTGTVFNAPAVIGKIKSCKTYGQGYRTVFPPLFTSIENFS